MQTKHDTPLGRFTICWGTSGGQEEFPPPGPSGESYDLFGFEDGEAGMLKLIEPRYGEGKRLSLHRSRSRPGALFLMGEITNGVWAQGTRIALPYPGPADCTRDAWLVGRPATAYDTDAWEIVTVEPYLLSLMRRGDEQAFEVHAECGLGWRTAIYPLDRSQADGLGADRHARILLAAAFHHAVQSDAAPNVTDFASLCDLVLAGPSEALSARLEAMRDVRFMLHHAYNLPPDSGAFAHDWFDAVDGGLESLDVASPEFGERSPWARDEVIHNAERSRFAAAINVHERTNMGETGRLVWGIVRDGRNKVVGRGDDLLAVCRTRPFAHWVTETTFVVRVAARDRTRSLLAVHMAGHFAILSRSDDGPIRPDEIVAADLEGAEWSTDLERLKPVAPLSQPKPDKLVSRLLGELRDIIRMLEPLTDRSKPRPARTRRAVGAEIGLDRDFERLEPALLAIGAEPEIVWRDPRGPDGYVTREYSWRGRLIRIDHTFEGRLAVKVSSGPAIPCNLAVACGWFPLETLVEPGSDPLLPGDLAEETDAETFLRRIALLPDASFPSATPPDVWFGPWS